MNKLFRRWFWVILITFIIRLSLLGLSWLTNPQGNIIMGWVRWDGPHYINIAKYWYPTQDDLSYSIVFYPLYPLLIKLFGFLIQDLYLSSLIINWILSFAVSIFMYELTMLDFTKKISLLSVWFLNIFPTSFFLQAGYTESLFLTTSLASIYFFRKYAFIKSGFFGALASFTRINGLFLLPFFITEPINVRTNKKVVTAIITCLITLAGFLLYLTVNYILFSDFFYFTKILSTHWYKKFDLPWVSVRNLIDFAQSQTGEKFHSFLGRICDYYIYSDNDHYLFIQNTTFLWCLYVV